MPNSVGPSSQSGGGTPSLQVQPITPQLLTNAQGQIIATVIGNQILPVINTRESHCHPLNLDSRYADCLKYDFIVLMCGFTFYRSLLDQVPANIY